MKKSKSLTKEKQTNRTTQLLLCFHFLHQGENGMENIYQRKVKTRGGGRKLAMSTYFALHSFYAEMISSVYQRKKTILECDKPQQE